MSTCRNIMVVSENILDLESLGNILEELDYDVTVHSKGAEALQDALQCPPAMIILDPDLADNAGLNLLKKLKGNKKTAPIVIILIYQNHCFDKILSGMQIGAEDYIEKPFNNNLLQIKLSNHLKWRESCQRVDKLNAQLSHEKKVIQEERNLLAKYFSKDLIDAVLSGTIGTDIGGDIQKASIMFCDMRNSTTISEQIGPSDFMNLINNLFTDLTDLIYGEKGSVNKFVGDGILATFGCPKSLEDDAYHAAMVAIKIRKYMENFNEFRPKYLKDPIQIGVGISRGNVFSGNVGSVNQIQYTVLGDPVNMASRLEGLSKRVKVDILIDGNIRDLLGTKAVVKKVKLTKVRGKMQQVRIYYLESLL